MKIHVSLAFKLCLFLVAATQLSSAATNTLSASPSAVVFQYNPPEPAPLPVFVTITASTGLTPSVQANVVAGPNTPTSLFPTPAISGNKLQVYYNATTFQQLSTVPGIYTATINVSSSGFPTLQVPVTLNIGGPLSIIPSPTSLAFYVPGTTTQNVNLSAAGGASIGFSVDFTTSGGGGWLGVVANQDYTPSTLSVTVNSLNIPGGTYEGTITVTPTSGNTTPLEIPVTLQIGPNTLSATPASFSFGYSLGGTVPLPQVLSLSSDIPNDTFVAQASSTGNWLLVNGATSEVSGTLPANLNITISPAGLPVGTYQGSITATDADNGEQTIPVTLVITAVSQVANPISLTFVAQQGQTSLPAQPLAINGFGSAFYTTTVQGSWLSLSSTSGAAPATINVTANPTGLQPGTYTGKITVDLNTHEQGVEVTLIVSATPVLTTDSGGFVYSFAGGNEAPAPFTLTVNVSSGNAQQFTYATGLPTWLQISTTPPPLSTPQILTITLTPQILPTGIYVAQVVLVPAATTAVPAPIPIVVPIVLVVTNAPGVVPATTTLNFSGTSGVGPETQAVEVSATTATTFNTSTNASWLSVSPNTATANLETSLTVIADATSLAPGSYVGIVTLTTTGGVISQITVNFSVAANGSSFGVAPAALAFGYVIGGATPASQTIQVTGSQNFTASASTTGGGGWLSVTPTSGANNATLTVSVNPANLAANTYSGSITVTPASGAPQTVAVTLTVGSAALLSAAPASLSFISTSASASPAPQTIVVTSTGQAATFTATPTSSGWLSVTPSSATTPATLTVSVNPGSLGTGSYTGSILLSANSGSLQLTVNVTLTVSLNLPTIKSVVNSASYLQGGLAPGEIVTLFGSALGPVAGAYPTVQNGFIGTTLASVQVTFNGYAAPILYAGDGQINTIVPYEIAGASTVLVESLFGNARSNSLTMPVVASAPGIYSADASGTGPGAILDLNYQLVTAANPVSPNGYIQVFATGAGQTQPGGVDGMIEPGTLPLPAPLLNITATVGGVPANVVYQGAAPGLVAGALQVDIQIPSSVPPGAAQVLIFAGNNSSQTGITVAVQ